MSLWCLLCLHSQTSVDPDHEGLGPCHRGEVVLGVPSQWEAQAVVLVAKERPAAALRGNKKIKKCSRSSATDQYFILKT